MSKYKLTGGTTSQLIDIFIPDSSSTTGAGLTGLVFDSAGLSAFYRREGAATGGTAISLVTATLGTWVSGGFVEIDATNLPGRYELGVPDAMIASGVKMTGAQLKGATNMAQTNLEIELSVFDMQSSAPDVNMASSDPNSIDAATPDDTYYAEVALNIWAELTSAIATSGSIGEFVLNVLPVRLTKNTAFASFQFFMVDSADHITPKTGLAITATRVIDAGAFAAAANAAVEIANGMYRINLAATDLNGDSITFKFAGAGADDRLVTVITQTKV